MAEIKRIWRSNSRHRQQCTQIGFRTVALQLSILNNIDGLRAVCGQFPSQRFRANTADQDSMNRIAISSR
ncbi:hypothetical protein D3C84_1237810 [compost metagenome]